MKAQLEELKPLIRLAAPIAFSHMANYFMQIVDTFFVAKLGSVPLGGVALGSGLFAIIMMIAIGILLGLDYLVSHAHGGKRHDDSQKLLVQGFYVAGLLAIPMIVLMQFLSLHFNWFGIAPDLARDAGDYLRALSFSLLPFLLFTACRQYLQATGTAGPILVVFLGANLLNALGNWVFIYGHWGFPKMGVAGAGLATTLSRTVMLISLFAYTMRRNRKKGWSIREAGFTFEPALVRKLLKLGLPAAGQLLLEVGVFVTSTFLIGHIGAIPLAAHQIVLQIASFTFMMPLGISAAAAVVVGQALGAHKPEQAVRLGWSAVFLGGGIMAVFGIALFVFSDVLLGAFTRDPLVMQIAKQLLLLAALFQIFDGIQVVGTGTLRGIGNTRASMIANLVGHWAIGLPIGAVLCFRMHWDGVGIWTGLVIGLASVALMLLGVWNKKTGTGLLQSPLHAS